MPKDVFKRGNTVATYIRSRKFPAQWLNTDIDTQTINILAELLAENGQEDQIHTKITSCGHPLCKCCDHIIASTSNDINPNVNMDCSTENIVYLITIMFKM